MTADTFLERYNKLNTEQKRAVDTIEGPVLVVAGPGTGKTEILTLRIANILRKTDSAPENILALTFTDAAAANMRRRLSVLIGASAYRVAIQTFHSFCNDVIKNYPEYFPTIIGSGNITEVESVHILQELVETLTLDILRPWGDPLYYIRDINRKIEELKREGVSPEGFLKIVEKEEKGFLSRTDLHHEKGAHKGKMKGEHKDFERQLQKNRELALVYAEYQKVLHTRRLYDYSDMIMEVLGALAKVRPPLLMEVGPSQDGDLKLALQETHQYILVDEHQDTNNAQNKILELLCDFHKNPNIFIVGDEKQAIFRFQGASIENFLYFKKLYPEAERIELLQNYRSGQGILDAAHSLIPTREPLQAGSLGKEDALIEVAEFTTSSLELYFVAERIKKLVESGVPAREIAVLYRSNREAFAMSHMLEKEDIGHIIESDEDLLSENFVRKFLAILLAVFHYGEDEYLIPVLHLDEFGIDTLDAYRLISQVSKDKKSLYDLIVVSELANVITFSQQLKSWAKYARNDGLTQFLERVLRESGILNSMIASKDAEAFLGIERLFEEGKRISANRPGATFLDFMEYIGILREHKLFIKRPKHATTLAVRLMTAHRSKGLEFEYVHILNATEKSFGSKNSRDSLPLLPSVYALDSKPDISEIETTEDERRLFYVALTRAKKSVFISYASQDENGKEVLPSPFVLEIRADRKSAVDTKAFEEKVKANPSPLFAERKPTAGRKIDQDFVRELFESHPLSVSALNNYLDCPWKYFYRNLLRIPAAPAKHQIYGTAMHEAVEDLWRGMREREIGLPFLLDSYKRHLGLLGVLSPQEFDEALRRGEEALTGWFTWTHPALTHPVLSEFRISGVELAPGVLPSILLSGNLDKVEMPSDTKAIVTDYKTGKPKSRNFIEGKTKEGTGDIKRQLQFYKLLLELHGKMHMEQGIIEFLEPNDSGNYSREEFEITDEEVTELKATITRVAEEITSLAFWDKTCDDKECEYCSYRKLLKS